MSGFLVRYLADNVSMADWEGYDLRTDPDMLHSVMYSPAGDVGDGHAIESVEPWVRLEGEGDDMRVMLLIKGDPEPGARPSDELLAAMRTFNDELKAAGVLLDLAGLYPSGEGKRVKFSGGETTVVDGPFEERDAIAGYWILQVPSIDEAVEWANRTPFEALARVYPGEYGASGEVEIRQVFEMEDPASR